MKRFFAIFLSLILTAALLAGCGSSAQEDETETSEAAEETTAASSEDSDTEVSGDLPDEVYEDVVYYLTDGLISSDDIVYTINGVDIRADYYFYWLTYEAYLYSLSYYNSFYVYPEITQEYSDGTSMAGYATEAAYNYSLRYALAYAQASEAGVELSGDYLEEYETFYSDSVTDLGESLWESAVYYGTVSEDDYDDDAKAAWIEAAGEAQMLLNLFYYSTTPEGMDDLYLFTAYFGQYRDELYLDGVISDDEIEAYIEEYDLLAARYVLVNDEDEALECYETLSSLSGDALDEAIAEYAASNLDGNTTGEVCFASSAELVDGFADMVSAIDIGEVTISDEMSGYYYIIVRDEVTRDTEITELEYSVEVSVAEICFEDDIDEWMDEAQIIDTGVLDEFDIYTYYENLEALRDLIDAL